LIVVSDTSPILNLAAVGKLSLLRDLYGEILIPPAVAVELARNAVQPDWTWTRIVEPQDCHQLALLRRDLDHGEAEAILVAGELGATLLLVDETRGRRAAINRGLNVTGLLGVLAEAKVRGLIPLCRPILDDMMRIAGFWIGEELRTRYLHALTESVEPPPA
jgi:predicted nucleic acid-binding protein